VEGSCEHGNEPSCSIKCSALVIDLDIRCGQIYAPTALLLYAMDKNQIRYVISVSCKVGARLN
jgi:hypothetical protein